MRADLCQLVVHLHIHHFGIFYFSSVCCRRHESGWDGVEVEDALNRQLGRAYQGQKIKVEKKEGGNSKSLKMNKEAKIRINVHIMKSQILTLFKFDVNSHFI